MMFAKMLTAALLALTVENVLFAGGAGFSRALRAARRPASAGFYALFVTVFSLCSGLTGYLLSPLFSSRYQIYPAAIAAAAAVLYLLAAALLRTAVPSFFEKYSSILAQAAVNTVVLAVPFLREMCSFGLAETIGFSLGTGAAFFLVVLLLEQALRICSNPDMPRAFSGLPGVLIYIGILSMVFAGLSGSVF
jgi:Na+-translocating ferredoxin:NAD+ oxidoreductase subunit A